MSVLNFIKDQSNVLRKIQIITIVLSLFVVAGSAVSLITITLWKNSLSSSASLDQLSAISDAAVDIRFRLASVLSDRLPTSSTRRKAIESWTQISENWHAYEEEHTEDMKTNDAYITAKQGYSYTKATIDELVLAYEADDKAKIATALDDKWAKIISDFTNPVKKLYDFHAEKIKNTTQESEKLTAKFTMGLIAMLALAVLISIYALLYLYNFKSRIQNIIESLTDLGKNVLESSRELNTNSDSLAGANDLNRQAIHETTTALEEITSIVQMTAANTKQSQDLTVTASDSIHEGEKAVNELSHSMDTINSSTHSMVSQFEDVNQNLESFVNIFNEVAEKTKVINDIVFQTRLLSFNASVEAARAGEHGKGFAVVADEIGALATLSGNSAQEISQIINTGRDQVKSIAQKVKEHSVNISKTATDSVTEGTESSKNIISAFGIISNNVDLIKSLMTDLSNSTNEQTKGIGEVSTSMRNINHSSEKASKSIEVTSAESVRLKEQAEKLFESMAELETLLNGKANHLSEQ